MKTNSMTIKDNELYIGEYKVSDLAKAYKTPLYIYDETQIREKLDIFKNNFKSDKYECLVVYASKAFLAPYICNIVKEYNMGIDSVSLGDLYLLEKASFPHDKIIMHGNNKSVEEIEYAINNNIGYLVIDNIDEIYTIDEVTKRLNKQVRVLIRVNPGIEAHTHAYIKTSLLSSKFGESIFDLSRLEEMLKVAKNNELIKMDGFHAHIGSNINSPQSFVGEVETMTNFIKKIKDDFGYTTKVLNLGGGFGIKYLDEDDDIDIKKMVEVITSSIDKFLLENNMTLDKVMIEPGRSIVGDSGFTVYTVGGIKTTFSGKKYIFVDGGMTDNIRPALYQAKYTVDIANKMKQEKSIPFDIVGKCCESGDIVAKDCMLSDVSKNDFLVAHCTGAYGYSMASNYNGALKSTVIFVRGKEVNMAVKREELSHLTKDHIFNNVKVFDTHSDMLYDLYTKKKSGVENRFNDFHVKQLLNSNVKAGLWTMYSPDDFDLIEACKIAINEIDIKKLPGFEVIYGLEGLRNLKKVEDIDVLYNMGIRHAMLTWNEENIYATGAKADPTHGLKEDGKRLLKRMEDLDMIIDLAHLNEKSFYEALEVTSKNIIYSHGNCKALCDHVRNVTDDQMVALKKVDGLLGLTLANNFVSSNVKDQTLDKFLEHLKHAVSIMGIDNVCFGFDFMDYLSDFPNSNLEEVSNASLVYRIVDGLESIGYSKEDINKICFDNFYKRYKDKIVLRG